MKGMGIFLVDSRQERHWDDSAFLGGAASHAFPPFLVIPLG